MHARQRILAHVQYNFTYSLEEIQLARFQTNKALVRRS